MTHAKTNSFFGKPLQHQMTHVKDYSFGDWDITIFLRVLAASNDTCIDKFIFRRKPWTVSNDTYKRLFNRGFGHNQFSQILCSIKWHMQKQTHFLEVNPSQHQMTHVKYFVKGVWDIATFLSILAASNDTCKDKLKWLMKSINLLGIGT